APQTITITGVDDALADGNQVYAVVFAAASSADAGYSGLIAPPVSVTNLDNDSAGIAVSAVSGATNEAGATASLTVRLNSQPTASVTIGVSSNDTTEGTAAPVSLT